MSSSYVFGNYALQYLSSSVATRFRMYAGIGNPVQIRVVSQDIQTDQYGQYTNISNVDLLGQGLPPYMPQANLGPNRIGFVGEPLFFDGSRSTQRNNLPATGHSWLVDGEQVLVARFDGQVSSFSYSTRFNSQDQVSITFAVPGIHILSLTVQDRFGANMTATRQIHIYQDRDSAPKGIMNLSGLSGSISSGGWQGQITTTQRSLAVPLPDAVPVGWYVPITLMCEMEYEVAPGAWVPAQIGQYGAPVPGQFYDDPRILFDGYIQSASAQEDADKDTVSYSLQTAQMVMQAANIHNIGFYNTSYNVRASNGEPLNQNTSSVGKGQLVTDLTSEDMYRALLTGYIDISSNFQGGHSNIGQYHDIIIWRDFLPNSTTGDWYYLTYSTLTANEGSVWDACTTMAHNEFCGVWCERNGSICIGPTYNVRGYELMKQPTSYLLLPIASVLGQGELSGLSTTARASSVPMLYLFGPNPLPVPQDFPSAPARSLSSLLGPPIVAHFSDVPVYDADPVAPINTGLFPWVSQNWPQDLSVRPGSIQVEENYTNRTAFVKLVATVASGQNVWSAWYPTTTFDSTGLMTSAQPAGAWNVQDSLLLADSTIGSGATGKQLSWQYLWEMARRLYLIANAQYSTSLEFGAAPWIRLHDVFLLTRQNAEDGPKLSGMPFYVTDITFNIDLSQPSWRTQIRGGQITTYGIGPMVTPPTAPPK